MGNHDLSESNVEKHNNKKPVAMSIIADQYI